MMPSCEANKALAELLPGCGGRVETETSYTYRNYAKGVKPYDLPTERRIAVPSQDWLRRAWRELWVMAQDVAGQAPTRPEAPIVPGIAEALIGDVRLRVSLPRWYPPDDPRKVTVLGADRLSEEYQSRRGFWDAALIVATLPDTDSLSEWRFSIEQPVNSPSEAWRAPRACLPDHWARGGKPYALGEVLYDKNGGTYPILSVSAKQVAARDAFGEEHRLSRRQLELLGHCYPGRRSYRCLETAGYTRKVEIAAAWLDSAETIPALLAAGPAEREPVYDYDA